MPGIYYLTRPSNLPPCPYPSTSAPKSPRPIPHETFLALKTRLRISRARYEHLADHHVRPRPRPRPKLAVDVAAAAGCPQRFVSADPLPVVDVSVNPYSPPVRAASEAIYPEPPRRWAAYVSAPAPDVPVEATESSWFEDIDFMADDEEEDERDSTSSSSSSSSEVPIYAPADDVLYHYPSSEESYGELLTPESSPLMIRIKRKSATMMEEEGMAVELAAKQPRYCRKSWVQPIRRV